MRFNENIAISTPKVLLVPYDAHHVPQYHEWMEDPAIREATASDRLSLEEEYENQISWRTSTDKLTFIVCKPPVFPPPSNAAAVYAGEADANDRMVGDINLFLTPWEGEGEGEGEGDDDDDDENAQHSLAVESTAVDGTNAEVSDTKRFCVGEVDIMIASTADRGKGVGKAAVSAFLYFVRENVDGLLAEYSRAGTGMEMKELLVRIKATNLGSIALFKGLGFVQRGEVNYFGEIEMVWKEFMGNETLGAVEAYRQLGYDRSRLAA
ncbi:GNAT domain-containing protein [Xylariales sp. AK1849]|nr:GNAT domain-containing protein [Xylariales sp. AK1849]